MDMDFSYIGPKTGTCPHLPGIIPTTSSVSVLFPVGIFLIQLR